MREKSEEDAIEMDNTAKKWKDGRVRKYMVFKVEQKGLEGDQKRDQKDINNVMEVIIRVMRLR